jgi:hypothetical protein
MNNDLTEIIFVLDKSGSMGSIRNDTIGGFNTFIQDQQELPGDAVFTLAMFNTQNTIEKRSVLLENVGELTQETYRPGGGTALLDAVGQTINDVVSRHATLEEDEKPGKTILVVLTDGEENSSKEFINVNDLGKMIKEREDAGWEVIFLGADIDAWADGSEMGFSKMRGMDKMDMKCNMSKMSYYTANYRMAGQQVGNATLDATFDMSDAEVNQKMADIKKKK